MSRSALGGGEPSTQRRRLRSSRSHPQRSPRGRPSGGRPSAHDCARAFQSATAGHGSDAVRHGRSGLGKTTLVEDFLVEIRLSDPACLIARGRCSERLAGAEAYLPFLEALDSLIRGNPSVGRVMKTVAPSWYVQLAMSLDASVERMMTESPAVSQER